MPEGYKTAPGEATLPIGVESRMLQRSPARLGNVHDFSAQLNDDGEHGGGGKKSGALLKSTFYYVKSTTICNYIKNEQ